MDGSVALSGLRGGGLRAARLQIGKTPTQRHFHTRKYSGTGRDYGYIGRPRGPGRAAFADEVWFYTIP